MSDDKLKITRRGFVKGAGVLTGAAALLAETAEGVAAGGQARKLGPGAVLSAVRQCWASLWSERAVAFRTHHGIASDGLAMAVVVQHFVPADAAGVLFTAKAHLTNNAPL